jgi:hypothetical protein
MRWLNIPDSLNNANIGDEKAQMRAALTRIKADVNMLHARSFGLMMGR